MRDTTQKREAWDEGVADAHGRARGAAFALIAIGSMHAWKGVLAVLPLSRTQAIQLSEITNLVVALLHLATVVLFLRWLAKTVDVARSLEISPPLAWNGRQACWSFFIPFLNLFRPYQVIRDLHDRLAPDGVPEPAPRPRMDGVGGYRRVEMEKAPPPGRLPRASIAAFWALYLFGGIAAQLTSVLVGSALSPRAAIYLQTLLSHGAEVASASLAVLVVRAIDGRLAERNRRLQHASDEELIEWGV